MLHQESKELLGMIVVYERVSDKKQDIERQRVQRERAAADYPGRDIEVIQDDGVSAFKVSVFDRPGSGQLCDLIEEGAVEALYVDSQSRLSRGDDVEWVTFRALCESTGTRVLIDGKELRHDLGGRMEGYLKTMLNRQESVEKSHNVRGGLREVAHNRGVQPCGQPPLGYKVVGTKKERRWVIDYVEAEIVRRIDAEYLAGYGANRIAANLNADGVRTRRGALFSARVILDMLKNPAYVGLVRLKGEVFPGAHEPIRSEETWAAIQEHQNARRALAGKGRGRPPVGLHLLTKGLGRCNLCGSAMTPRTNRNGYQYYICTRRHTYRDCEMPIVNRRPVDEQLLAEFEAEHVDLPGTLAAINEHAERKLAEARALAEAADLQAARAEAGRQKADRDYLDVEKGISAENYARLCELAESEGEAARAEAERMRSQAAEIEAEVSGLNAKKEMKERLDLLRQAIAGRIDNADGVDALRADFLATFKEIAFVQVDGELFLIPTLREEAIAGWTSDPDDLDDAPVRLWVADSDGIRTPMPRKVALHLGKEMEASVAWPPDRPGRRGRRSSATERRSGCAPRPRRASARGQRGQR
jgi:DNA invertase Pin-like site-specific DNA recombinase